MEKLTQISCDYPGYLSPPGLWKAWDKEHLASERVPYKELKVLCPTCWAVCYSLLITFIVSSKGQLGQISVLIWEAQSGPQLASCFPPSHPRSRLPSPCSLGCHEDRGSSAAAFRLEASSHPNMFITTLNSLVCPENAKRYMRTTCKEWDECTSFPAGTESLVLCVTTH